MTRMRAVRWPADVPLSKFQSSSDTSCFTIEEGSVKKLCELKVLDLFVKVLCVLHTAAGKPIFYFLLQFCFQLGV